MIELYKVGMIGILIKDKEHKGLHLHKGSAIEIKDVNIEGVFLVSVNGSSFNICVDDQDILITKL